MTNCIKIIFEIPGFTIGDTGPDSGTISFGESTTILLNDGRGTPAELIIGDSLFSIVPPGQAEGGRDWFDVLDDDRVKPEQFSIELIRDESVFDGKWFIIFKTSLLSHCFLQKIGEILP